MASNKVAPTDEAEEPPPAAAPAPAPAPAAGGGGAAGSDFSDPEVEEIKPDTHEHADRNYSPDSMGDPVPTPLLSSVRLRLAFVTAFGFVVLYGQRTNLSIAMVCMTKAHYKNHSKDEDIKCPEMEHSDSEDGFEWDKALQGWILGSFFYGYLVLQVPGGMLSERYGAKIVITLGMAPVAVLSLLTPILTKISWILLLVLRVVMGLGEAVMYPAATALWAKWSPPLERSMLVGISLSGGQLGNAVTLPVGGLLCASLGWESVFYVLGAAGMVFVLLWMFWVTSTPDTNKSLGKDERTYLERTVPQVDSKVHSTPWGRILTSLPVWAILIAHMFGNYTYYMNLTQIPTYMKEVLKFDIEANGAFSMIPYLVFWISTFGAGILSDIIISKKVPMIVVRKSFAFVGLTGPAIFLVATAYVDCENKYYAILTLCCAVGLTGFGFASYLVNHGDLAPDLAGTLFGLSNTLSTLPGFIAPTIVGVITPNGTADEWRTAFFIAAAINAAGAVFYVLFASCDIQPWSAAHAVAHKPHDDTERLMAVYKPATLREAEMMGTKVTMRRLSTVMHV